MKTISIRRPDPYHTSYQQPIYIQLGNHSYAWHKRHILGWCLFFFLELLTPYEQGAQLELLGLLWLLYILSSQLLLFELFPSQCLCAEMTLWGTRCPLTF